MKTRLLIVLSALLWTLPSRAGDLLPPPTDSVRPDPEPELPAAFEAFDPPVDPGVKPSGPAEIAEWTRSAGPGQTVVFSGSGFGAASGFRIFSQGDEPKLAEAKALAFSSCGAALTLPEDLPAGRLYFAWPFSPEGTGSPVAINRAEAWWLLPAKATRGERVSLHGRNLSFQQGTEKSWILLQQKGQPGVWAEVVEVNPYKVDFLIPADLPNGTWDVWVHNGHGGHFGWHSPAFDNPGTFTPATLEVADARQWDGGQKNVKEFGAKGDGASDDTAAILAALAAAASAERATLFFPEGTYVIQAPIEPVAGPSGSAIRLLGEGPDKSIIQCAPDSGQSTMLVLAGNGVEVRGIAFRLNSLVGREKPMGKKSVISTAKGWREGLCLADCIIDGERSMGLQLAGYKNVVISGCEVTGNENQMGTLNSVHVDRCKFLGRADAGMALYWLGGYNVSVTNCSAEDFDKSGPDVWDQFQGRFVTASAYGQRVDNWYVAHNRTTDLAVRPSFHNQNTGEQVMWEFMDPRGQSTVREATADTVTLAEPVNAERVEWFANAIIIDGKGCGQSRQIKKYDPSTGTAELSRPWRVIPDASSTVLLTYNIQRVVVYDNDLDGKSWNVENEKHTASTGVQPFGASHTLLVDGNRMSDLRIGIAGYGTADPKKSGVSPTFFNLYQNNSFQTVRSGVYMRSGKDPSANPVGLAMLGNVVRKNSATGVLEQGIAVEPKGVGERVMADLNVLEANAVTNTPVGFRIGEKGAPLATKNTLILRNVLDRGTSDASDTVGIRLLGEGSSLLIDNKVENFGTPVDGDAGSSQ